MKKNRGLTGNSGFVAPGLHIAANYDCNGMVFVEVEDPEWGLIWERMESIEAHEKGLQIIKCALCEKPATSIDHYFPYYQEMNRCDDHLGNYVEP